MVVLPQIESRRLYRQIAGIISAHIEAGDFPPGSLLPAERELAQQMGVSRASVREALIALEVEGRVMVRVGHGVTVLDVPAAPEISPQEVGPIEILEARLLVECETASLAAARATPEDLVALEQTITDLTREIDAIQSPDDGSPPDYARTAPADQRFHEKIAEMSGNQAYARLVSVLWSLRDSRLFAKFQGHFVTGRQMADTIADHRRILDALRAGDSAGASAAMRRHLTAVLDAFLKNLE